MPSLLLLFKAFLAGLPYLLMAFALGVGWSMYMKKKHPELKSSGFFVFPFLRDHRGLSLAFVIVISTIALVVGSRMVNRAVHAKLRAVDMFRGIQAEYAARAALRQAFSEVKAKDPVTGIREPLPGYEKNDGSLVLGDTNDDGLDDVSMEYTIFSRSKPLDWQDVNASECGENAFECFVPIPGTGSVGTGIPGERCDFEDTTQGWSEDFEHGCNWNRIDFGETVSIPLHYVYNTNDTSIFCEDGFCDPKDTGLMNFSLRVRTPKDSNGARYVLDATDDRVVVNWEIDGKCQGTEGGGGCYLIGMLEESPIETIDSFIRASTINIPIESHYGVLNKDSLGQDAQNNFRVPLVKFLTSDTYKITEPFLKLSVVAPLKASDMQSVPYLEYQIVTDREISDSKWIYTALGKTEGKLGTYLFPMTASQSIGANPVINFVVQN